MANHNLLNFKNIINQYEQSFLIPKNTLNAIANIESGRKIGKTFAPWPWTINVNGKGYFFNSKQEAIDAIIKFQNSGIKSIDVGLMQINLKFHPNAFNSLSDALDPGKNIAYGAKFLKNLFNQFGNWHDAIANYHSNSSVYNVKYKQKVLNFLKNNLNNANFHNIALNTKSSATIKTIKPYISVSRKYYSLNGENNIPANNFFYNTSLKKTAITSNKAKIIKTNHSHNKHLKNIYYENESASCKKYYTLE